MEYHNYYCQIERNSNPEIPGFELRPGISGSPDPGMQSLVMKLCLHVMLIFLKFRRIIPRINVALAIYYFPTLQ